MTKNSNLLRVLKMLTMHKQPSLFSKLSKLWGLKWVIRIKKKTKEKRKMAILKTLTLMLNLRQVKKLPRWKS